MNAYSSQDTQGAASVGLFAGFLSLLQDAGPAKLLTAFLIALATGAGYKLGSWAVGHVIYKMTGRARLTKTDEREK